MGKITVNYNLQPWQERMNVEIKQTKERLIGLNKMLDKDMEVLKREVKEYTELPMDYIASLHTQRVAMSNYLKELNHQRSLWINFKVKGE